MFQNKNRKFIYIVAAIAVLVFAFWYGGASPGSQGFFIKSGNPQHITVSASDKVTENAGKNQETNPAERQSNENSFKSSSTESDIALSNEPGESSIQKPENDGETETQVNTPEEAKETTPAPGQNQQQGKDAEKAENQAKTCTMSISCATILNNMDWLDSAKKEIIPADGWILRPVTVPFNEGESVFNILQRTCKQEGIQMEFANTPIYKSAYIEGIYNLCEFDCGEQSGWMYKVNDWFPNYSCSKYILKDGDVICWEYTCELGADVGGSFEEQTSEE